jgi:hypothetical protein
MEMQTLTLEREEAIDVTRAVLYIYTLVLLVRLLHHLVLAIDQWAQ